jgi:intein/homing endonuclease
MQGLKNFEIPFDLNDPISQYWLGYICADGNIQYNKIYRVYGVALFSKDQEIIIKFGEFMGDRCKYHFRKQNNIYEAKVNSKQLCEYMISLNITPNKGLTLNPNLEITRDFLRGYFDGDGSIRKDRAEGKITCGSKIFIDRICKLLTQLKIYYKIREKGNAYDICMERKLDFLKFLDFIYKDSSIYLDRKYKQYVALHGNK